MNRENWGVGEYGQHKHGNFTLPYLSLWFLAFNPNALCVLMWEGREGWMKEDRRRKRSHDVLSRFQTWDLSHPNDEPDASHWGYVTKSQRICGYMRVCRVMLLSLVSCLIVLASGITAGGTGGTVPPWSRPVGKSTLPTGKNEGYTLLKLHVVLQSSISSRKQQKQGKIIGIL